jgi:Mrp family chromosome partitioning ATPase
VIIDSPPVMAVTDASLIANLVGGVLFVVAAEQTMGPIAVNALDQLDGANATFVGAVLNRVDLERNAFFYSSYYRAEYGKYYVPN